MDTILDYSDGERASYAELAADQGIAASFRAEPDHGVAVTAVDEWEVLGGLAPRPAIRDLVTGAHRFPSDITRPGMLYGAVLRAPRYLSELVGVDTVSAEAPG